MMKLLLILIPFLLYACEKEDDTLRVNSISYRSATTMIGEKQDRTRFEVLDNGYLKIYRKNIVFNCTLDSLEIRLSSAGSSISISEIPYYHTSPYPTYCVSCKCEYDLEYTIGPLVPKNYLIHIEGSPEISISIPHPPVNFRR